VAFFESHEGQEFLHQFCVALLAELYERGNASLGVLSTFLHRANLHYFVAASETNLQRAAAELERHIIAFGQEERRRLAGVMPRKTISIAEDETFPSRTCLVAIEPVSNFILLERLTDDRKAGTWNESMHDALSGLAVTTMQSVSDEGKSVVKHAVEGLGAHHSPDLFHIQQEITKAASTQLRLQVKRGEETVRKQREKTTSEIESKARYERLEKKPQGRPPAFDARIREQRAAEFKAVAELRRCIATREQFHAARRSISAAYHPYSLETGLPQSPERVAEHLTGAFDKIDKLTAGLADTFKKRIAKARKQIAGMKATVAFYFTMVALYLDNLRLDHMTRMLLEDFLIPACYLQRVARTVSDKAISAEILHTSQHLMADCSARAGPFALYTEERLRELLGYAEECADYFQRSSSCTEGRNGQLSLRYHNLHILTDRKLAALTVLHNFDTRRADGTTPARRFFGTPHRELFPFLLLQMKPPGRPRVRHRLAPAA
jgi:hypothetical protein